MNIIRLDNNRAYEFECDGSFHVLTINNNTYLFHGSCFIDRNFEDNPRFKHDCKDCILLFIDEKYDYYVCFKEPTNDYTIVARYGNEPSDNISGKQHFPEVDKVVKYLDLDRILKELNKDQS